MKAKIQIQKDAVISRIDDRLYSSFIEHMGRGVYTGIYEPGHPMADEEGLRRDVIELIKPLNLAYIRYPGGNFVSGYRWEDGVGDKASRPVRRDLAWMALETNQFGTNEFCSFCKKAGVKPMLAVNLGTRGIQEAMDYVEYCNVPGGTYLSDLRRSHGVEQPHGVDLWCVGNEMDGPWQIGAKTAEEYGRLAHETAKVMKWVDPSAELVACGSSNRQMPTFGTWERTVLEHCYEEIDYLSLHQYYKNTDGDVAAFLANSVEMDGYIKEVASIAEEVGRKKGSQKKIYLSFDEWNVWYHSKTGKQPEKWISARPIAEEAYDFADALLVGCILNTLINNSDNVKISCMAQLVNVIAPIMTVPGGKAWVQTIYYPYLYASRYGRGKALKAKVDVDAYRCRVGENIPFIDCAATLSEDGAVNIFLVNRSGTDVIETQIEGIDAHTILEAAELSGYALDQINTADEQIVQPKPSHAAALDENGLRISLQPCSWYCIRVK